MKLIPRHSKSIEIEFTNMNTRDVCFRATIPLTSQKQVRISELYKKLKPAVADGENVSATRITAKHAVIDSVHIGRIIFEWRGGISIDMPMDVNKYDFKIFLAQLDVLKMRFDYDAH